MRNAFIVIIATFAAIGRLDAATPSAPPALVAPVLAQSLPDFKGKEVVILTVEYPPGGVSGEHRHNAHTFVYVLEGAVEMQVAGGELVTLNPGDTFYEKPADIHSVSRNASTDQPAKFLVFFIKDEGAPATTAVD